jgi:hypothetical protein
VCRFFLSHRMNPTLLGLPSQHSWGSTFFSKLPHCSAAQGFDVLLPGPSTHMQNPCLGQKVTLQGSFTGIHGLLSWCMYSFTYCDCLDGNRKPGPLRQECWAVSSVFIQIVGRFDSPGARRQSAWLVVGWVKVSTWQVNMGWPDIHWLTRAQGGLVAA